MTRLLLILLGSILISSVTALGADDPTAVCLAMVTAAAHNVNLTTSSSQYLYTLFDNYCKSDGSTKQSSWNAGLSAVVQAIPVSLTGGAADASTAFSNFCRNYASTAAASNSSYSMESNVVEKALESANQCMTIASKGSYITYRIMTPNTLAINFSIGAGNPLNIRGVSHDTSVECQGSKAAGGGVVRYSTGVGQSLSSDLGAYSITCTRTPVKGSARVEYAETSVVLDTNAGGFDVYWPHETVLPLRDASAIQASIDSLRQQLAATTSIAAGAQGKLDTAVGHYNTDIPGQAVTNAFAPGAVSRGSGAATCPAGQYLAGISLEWAGTCNNQCNADGGVLHSVSPICRALF